MRSIFLGLKHLTWPVVILILGAGLLYLTSIYLLDLNKISAATNRANCQIQLMKEKLEDLTLCKDIFDSARR
jgi:hypothetical protein